MQFIVFAAFAIVLSVPEKGPPWETIHSPFWTAVIVAGQVVLAALVAAVGSWLVKRKLEYNPAWLPAAQRRMGQCSAVLRFVLIGGFTASVYLTDWSRFIARVDWMQRVWGLGEMVMLLPFLLGTVVSWVLLYPADRGIRQVSFDLRMWVNQPTHPAWSMWSYVTFMFRHHVLIILAPMVPIVMAIDAVSTANYGRWLRQVTGVSWADQAVLVVVAGAVFLVAPVFLRFIWHTQSLPRGDLRARLDILCRKVGLRYRDILIWESDGMVVNAAVMGLLRPVRYILLSDGLLETMDDRKIEAVFGHEAGHVKHHHITFYLLFAITSMLIVGGISELVMREGRPMLGWLLTPATLKQVPDYLHVSAMLMVVGVWAMWFGPVSRRFEWQADLFGARSVTPPAEGCDRPCVLHGTYPLDSTTQTKPIRPDLALCASGAHVFGEALERIAALNGIPLEARSWRHSSIGNRVRLLKRYAVDPNAVLRLNRAVAGIKAFLVVATIVGLGIGAWLYQADFVRLLHKWG